MPVLRQLLGAVAQNELQGIKRRATVAGFTLAAAFLVSLASVFAFLALFLWLLTQFEPWQAALIVVAALLLGALMVWLAGRLVAGGASRSRSRSNVRMQAMLDEAARNTSRDDVSVPAITTALALGFAIGRRISK